MENTRGGVYRAACCVEQWFSNFVMSRTPKWTLISLSIPMDPSLLLPQIVLVLSHLSNQLLGRASSHCLSVC